MFNNFFFNSCRLWDNVEKYCRTEQATDDKMNALTDTHSECVILFAFLVQQLHERPSILRYTYIACLVSGYLRIWKFVPRCQEIIIGAGDKFLLITNLKHFFTYLFISSLYTFRASQCSSSGDRIVLIHHLAWLVCVNDCLVCRSGIPSSHLQRLIIPDDVLIQFGLLMMSAVTLETFRDMK